jgi:hypothetical protein
LGLSLNFYLLWGELAGIAIGSLSGITEINFKKFPTKD